jgi:acetolactate synthase-1/2/3 large subunit
MAGSTVGDILVDGLLRAGTPRLFRAGDDPIARALSAAAQRRGLAVVEVAGDGAACVMAAVTAELSDAPGAAIVRLGPATQAVVDGAAHAARDRAPVIVITDRHEDATLLAPVTKASLLAEPASAAHWIAHAAQLALSEPRGPVHIALAASAVDRGALPVATACRPGSPPPPDARVLDAAARALAGATRPLLVFGLQCRPDDAKWLRALAEALPAPVLATAKAKGVLPDPHPLALGLLADPAAAAALRPRADLIVTIGVDPGEIGPGSWPAAIPVLRLARSAGGGEYIAELIGDLSLIVEELAPRLRSREQADWDVAELDRIKRASLAAGTGRRRLVQIAREMTEAGALAAIDVAEALAWQVVAPGELLVATGFATPGFALPAAIAAQLARPDRRVLAFAAAGGLRASRAELPTLARLALPITVVVSGDAEAAAEVVVAARAAGLDVLRAAGETAFRFAFERALGAGRPVLIV